MNELIKINTDGQKESVNARELHEFLGSKQDFSTWIKNRIAKYGFAENLDFVRFHKKMEANNATIIDYYISIDMAKELSMVENNAKGREARQYFILMEKRAKVLTSPELSEAEIVQKALQIQEKKIKQLSIKAQVADELTDTKGLFLPSTVGKMISGESNNFCEWLVQDGIMYRKGQSKKLVPKSPYDKKERGYFYIKISTYGDGKSTIQTYFTARGVCWIQARYLIRNNLLNLDYTEAE